MIMNGEAAASVTAQRATAQRARIERRSSSSSFRALLVVVPLVFTVVILPSACAAAVAAPRKTPKFLPATKPTKSTNVKTTTATSSSNNNNLAWTNGLKSGAASASAAACVKTLLQPIDAIKTVQQFHEGAVNLSVWAATRQLLQRPGGLLNLYAGLGVTVIGAMPGVSLYFGVYSYCKERLSATRFGREHGVATVAVSAAIGNTVASFSRVPYEVLKQKLQAGIYTSTGQALAEMVAHPSSCWALLFPKGGVWGQMIRDVPYAVVTLLVYESLQSHFAGGGGGGEKPKSSRRLDFLLGGTAGGVGSWVTTPMDVVKTRLQTMKGGGSVLEVTRTVWAEGGAPAFLRGAVPRLMHKVPANALFFYFYEFFKTLYRVKAATAAPAKVQ